MKILTLFLSIFFLQAGQLNQFLIPSCSVFWRVDNAGFEVEGTLKVLDATIEFDPQDLSQSIIRVTADATSIQTGINIRDKHLKRSDYFDVEKHPVIELRSKNFRKKKGNQFIGEFDLTIKSVTKEIVIPFTVLEQNNKMQYTANFEINRLDFGIGERSLTLAEKVNISVAAALP
jgi:polyisoprenoid-binding protein YceI